MLTQNFLVSLVMETCCKCGMSFGLPQAVQKRRLEDKGDFYCPSGHCQHYTGETAEARLERAQKEIAMLKDSREAERRERFRQERLKHEAHERRKKLEKRIKNGVCPCCNRTFSNLQRHMATKHPGSAPKEEKP